MEKFLQRIANRIDEGDIVDDDDLDSSIQNVVSEDDIIKEIIQEDDDTKEALRKKIKELILEKIEGIDSLDGVIEDFDEDDFCICDYLPDDHNAESILRNLFETDKELIEILSQKNRELVISWIEDNYDEDDLPDNWKEIIDFESIIKYVTSSSSFQEKSEDAVGETILETLPEQINIKENSDITNLLTKSAKRISEDREFSTQLEERLKGLLLRDKDLGQQLLNVFLTEMAKHMINQIFSKKSLY